MRCGEERTKLTQTQRQTPPQEPKSQISNHRTHRQARQHRKRGVNRPLQYPAVGRHVDMDAAGGWLGAHGRVWGVEEDEGRYEQGVYLPGVKAEEGCYE